MFSHEVGINVNLNTGEVGPDVNVIVTNFSGGKRHSSSFGVEDDSFGVEDGGVEQLARLADSGRANLGVVLLIQEMSVVGPDLPTRAFALEQALDWPAVSSFVPRVSTAWYPLVKKWNRVVDPSRSGNEGLCVVTGEEGVALAPWAVPDGPASADSPTRVLDLPNFEFPDDSTIGENGTDWLQTSFLFHGVSTDVSFRPSYYRGSRDSDPRIAQTCLLSWRPPGAGAEPLPQCVLVNVHLSTLSREYPGGSRQGPRVPNAEAAFLRDLPLQVIARYVREVRATRGLEVVIAGDFNSTPDSTEMLRFAEDSSLVPLLGDDVCWRCGAHQEPRSEVSFYDYGKKGLALTMTPQPGKDPALRTSAVCCNDLCREPRFTHKRNLQLVDNVFVAPHLNGLGPSIAAGKPPLDISWGYSDHAAIIVPFGVANGPSLKTTLEMEVVK